MKQRMSPESMSPDELVDFVKAVKRPVMVSWYHLEELFNDMAVSARRGCMLGRGYDYCVKEKWMVVNRSIVCEMMVRNGLGVRRPFVELDNPFAVVVGLGLS